MVYKGRGDVYDQVDRTVDDLVRVVLQRAVVLHIYLTPEDTDRYIVI